MRRAPGAAAETLYVDFIYAPVIDEAGRVTGIITQGHDVTDAHRTREALRQSQKLEAMGQLTGGVAHDFNNLLTPIIGVLDLIQRRGPGDERVRRLINGAMQSADRAKTLVQRLLAFARRQPLQSVAVDLADLITGMADLVAGTCGPQIRLHLRMQIGLPPIRTDPNQLEMAILNLCANARDAMPDGGELTISALPETIAPDHHPALPPGRHVRLSVADTGQGMDAATLARAVERSSRPRTSAAAPGSACRWCTAWRRSSAAA